MGERAHKLLALVGLATGKTLASQAKFGQASWTAVELRNRAIAQRSETSAAPRSHRESFSRGQAIAAELEHCKK